MINETILDEVKVLRLASRCDATLPACNFRKGEEGGWYST